MAYFIGLMSGTSSDGIDAALVNFSETSFTLAATHTETISPDIRQAIFKLTKPSHNELSQFGILDRQIGLLFAKAVINLLKKTCLTPADITAIGSHGQTIRHTPNGLAAYTLQIGDPNTITHKTGIMTVADFRRRDIAAGGEGAPLAPAFHKAMFHSSDEDRIILNIGGIANITVLPSKTNKSTIGFDTGPGNTLMDRWTQIHFDQAFDKDGALAAEGKTINSLLTKWLADPYFQKAPPKSSGPDYFNHQWLNSVSSMEHLNQKDVLATLTDFTAQSIANAIKLFSANRIFVCGGGVHNRTLMKKLQHALPSHQLDSTDTLNLNPDWVEAVAFAWLAKQTLEQKTGNLPSVTGAKTACILGNICFP